MRLCRPYFASVAMQDMYYDCNGQDNSINDDSGLLYQLIKDTLKIIIIPPDLNISNHLAMVH